MSKQIYADHYNVDEHAVRQFAFNNLDAIVYANLEGIVQYANPSAERLYGYEPGELLGKHVDVFNSQETHNTQEIIDAIVNTGAWSGDIVQARKNGESFHAFLSVTLIFDQNGKPIGYSSNSHEVTERIENEAILKKTLKEKEILLSEIHHRLKNNLAIISSILELQKTNLTDLEATGILTDCQNRIISTALVHDMLYQNNSLSSIQLLDYIDQLGDKLKASYSNHNIDIDVSGDEVLLHLEKAIPCGLIINELVSNSVKHAFEGDGGNISIKLTGQGNQVQLHIEDDGKGVDDQFELEGAETTGLVLVNTFAEQLDGELVLHQRKPLSFQLTFPLND